MSIREIPRAYEYRCDRCGATHLQESAAGHYTESTPPNWATLKWLSDKWALWVDGQGALSIQLLCETCAEAVSRAINDAVTTDGKYEDGRA